MIRKFYSEYNSQSESTLLDCQRMRLALIVAKYWNIWCIFGFDNRANPPLRNSQFPKWAEFKGDLGPSKTDNFKKYTGDWGCGPVLINERLGFYLVIKHLITWFWINYLILFGATAILALGIEASPWSMNKGSLNFHIFKKPKANSGPSDSSFLRSKGGTSPWASFLSTRSPCNLQGDVLGFSHQRSGLGVVLSVSINSAPSKGPDTTLVPWKLTRMVAGTQYPWDLTATSYIPPPLAPPDRHDSQSQNFWTWFARKVSKYAPESPFR